jgi:hypothetical protein
MDATLSACGRGQAPKPRSGASKTPGLRSGAGRKTLQPAVSLPPRLVHGTELTTAAGIADSVQDAGAGDGNEARVASNASGAK